MSVRVALVAALSVPLLVACGGSGGDGSSPSSSSAQFGEKDLETATAAMQEYSDRYTSGDYAGAYELAAQSTRDAWTVEEFTKIQEGCYTGEGMPLDVEGVRINGDEATVRLVLGEFKQSRTMVYEDGSWKAKPSNDSPMSGTVEDAIADCKAA